MKPMTRHLPGFVSDAIDDLTAIHIALSDSPELPNKALRNSTQHLALAMLSNVIARLTSSLEMVE